MMMVGGDDDDDDDGGGDGGDHGRCQSDDDTADAEICTISIEFCISGQAKQMRPDGYEITEILAGNNDEGDDDDDDDEDDVDDDDEGDDGDDDDDDDVGFI